MINDKNFFVTNVKNKENKKGVHRFVQFCDSVLKNKMEELIYDIPDNKDFFKISFLSNTVINSENNKSISVLVKHRNSYDKKVIENKIVSDLHNFLREFFVYVYIQDIKYIEEENNKSIRVDYIINTNNVNFKELAIRNNIEHSVKNLHNIR